MSFVVTDIGASSTRYVADEGVKKILPNNMVFLGDEKVDLTPSDDNVESALELKIEKEGNSEYFPARVLIGSLAERYSVTNERPTVMVNKHKQRINYVSAIAATAISNINLETNNNIHLYIALPPIEVKNAKEIVQKNLLGNYTVTLPKFRGGKTIKFKIVSVNCYEESYMAMTSFFFSEEGKLKDEIKKYTTGYVLSLDIGASTTDLCIVKNGVYLEQTGQTYRTGGNIAKDFLSDSVRAEFGYDLPYDESEAAMAEGRIKNGSKYKDISNLVANAKKTFSKALVEQMQGYFRQVNIPIQAIQAIVVSGGGSMESSYIDEATGEPIKTTEAMSHYITEELIKISDGTEVVHYGNEPRLANVKGLLIRARFDAIMKKKTATN